MPQVEIVAAAERQRHPRPFVPAHGEAPRHRADGGPRRRLSRLWPTLAAAAWQPEAVAFLVAVGAVVVAGYWTVLTSETSIDERAIRQSAPWRKEVALADITQVKFVHIAGLDALIVPRLVVRSRGLGLTTFTAGDARLVQAFRVLAQGNTAAGVTKAAAQPHARRYARASAQGNAARRSICRGPALVMRPLPEPAHAQPAPRSHARRTRRRRLRHRCRRGAGDAAPGQQAARAAGGEAARRAAPCSRRRRCCARRGAGAACGAAAGLHGARLRRQPAVGERRGNGNLCTDSARVQVALLYPAPTLAGIVAGAGLVPVVGTPTPAQLAHEGFEVHATGDGLHVRLTGGSDAMKCAFVYRAPAALGQAPELSPALTAGC
ncbi:MAG: hypothetical protein U1F49_11405 [Rubrivivax sp.]